MVTRERGKNDKLMKRLHQRGISVLELPLVETAVGPDRSELPDALTAGDHDWVIVTSPESASVFLQGWREAGKPQVCHMLDIAQTDPYLSSDHASQLHACARIDPHLLPLNLWVNGGMPAWHCSQ